MIGADGGQIGVMETREAMKLAQEAGLDLVEISPTAQPPVCKIIDYGKYKYEQAKKEKENKKKQHEIEIKEIRLRPKIDSNDLMVKVRRAREFLEEKAKVKVSLLFRGREMAHQEFGEKVIQEFLEKVSDVGKPETPPKMEGKMIILYLVNK